MKLNPATKSEQPARGPSPRGLLGGDLERSRLGDGLRLCGVGGGCEGVQRLGGDGLRLCGVGRGCEGVQCLRDGLRL